MSGQTRYALAITSATRLEPVEINEKLNRETNEGLADAKIKGTDHKSWLRCVSSFLPDFGKFIVEYTDKRDKVIRAANIKAE